MSYKNEWSGHQVIKHFEGHLTGADFVRSVKAVCGDERFDRLESVINDFSQVASLEVDESSIIDAAALTIGVSVVNPRLKVAFVVPEGEVGRKVQDILAPQVVPSYPHKVFTSLEQAQHWVRASHG